MEVRISPETILAFIGEYLAAALAVFLLYSPFVVLFVILLLTAGVLRLLAWPFIVLISRLRGKKGADGRSEGTWLFH